MLSISGAPNVEGLTIDTAAQDHKIIDKWANGLRDVSIYFCETVKPRGGQITAGGKKSARQGFFHVPSKLFMKITFLKLVRNLQNLILKYTTIGTSIKLNMVTSF